MLIVMEHDTRMVLSDTGAAAIESSFISSSWTVGDGTLDNELPVEFLYLLTIQIHLIQQQQLITQLQLQEM